MRVIIRRLLKSIVLAFFLAPLLLSIEANTTAGIRNSDSDGVTIVCFGDSLTYGYGAERSEAYPSVLAKYIGEPVINAGVDSDSSAMGLSRMDDDVLSRRPYLVIIGFGANDFLDKIPLEETRANMREMVRRIQDAGAMVAIIDISCGILFTEYRMLAQSLARETDSIFISGALRGIITNPSLKSDFVHPNAKGYSIIAQRVFLAVRPHLLQRHFAHSSQ
jgi:acyl-CoA thioesterase I